MIDYSTINAALISAIKSKLNYPVIVANGAGTQPPYPFCTFTVITPYLPIGAGELSPDSLTEHVEIVISFTWHTTGHAQALNLAMQTSTLFKLTSTRQKLSDQGIVIVSATDSSSRDTFLTVDTERDAGFDLRIRVANVVQDTDAETIEHVSTSTNTNQ
jgi:hypothetical protein